MNVNLLGKSIKSQKKHHHYFCMDCKLRRIVDYERSILVCTKCGLCEYYPVYVASYNHTMQPLRRKCIYKRSDNFKVILNQFFYGGKRVVRDDIMKTIRDEIHNETNILYNYTIPITIPILECILKRNELSTYKDSIYFIYFKLSGGSFPHITTKEYNTILNTLNVISNYMTNTNLMIGRAFFFFFLIYGIHSVHCGLVYVGETGRSLRSRMNGHRSAIKKGGQSLLHRHFHQPDHFVDDMRVQILEKVYHSSENPTLLTSLRRTRELFWIKELGTAKPYGFNDQIKGVGTLSSISCKKTNIYTLFNKQPRRKRSYGKRRYNKRAPQPDITMSTLVDLVDMTEKPEGVHKINTKLFSISFPQLRCLQELALESTNFDYSSAEYRVIAIILDIANFRLFRPVRSDVPAENPKHFMKIKFLNKAVNVINLRALLRSTSVTNKIPVYFRDKEPPIVSYEYTSTVASKLFNFSPALSNLNVSEYFSNPQTCQCKESKFCYEPHGHVITGDLRVIENAKLRELVAKGPKYREPNRVNWKATETMFLESIDLYAKNWSEREQVELKYLSEWKDQLKELVADRISNLKGHYKSPKCKVLDQTDVKDTLHKLYANYVLVPADKAANNVIIVCRKYYIDTLVKE